MRTKNLRLPALLAALALVAAACGGGDDTATTEAPAETTTTEAMVEETTETTEAMVEETTTTAATGSASADGTLVVGTLLPETGDLAFLGPPEVAGARLAVEDINAAGGVLGNDVVLVEGDSGDTKTDTANQTVDRLLAEGADVIVGAASSAVSKTVIDKIVAANVIQFSPANTSPDFTTYDDNGLYFRTAPSDLLQGRVLAQQVADQDNATAAVIYRQESYGEGLANAFQENYEGLGGTIPEFIAYAPDTTNFDAEVDALVAADPEAIVVIGFEESATILETMVSKGIGPDAKNVWGVDGNIGGIGGQVSDPAILAGLKGTEPSVDLSTISDFTARLDGAYEGGVGGVFAYGAETYDAIIITALAAVVAGSDDPLAIAAEINGVTKDGEKCTDFASCLAIIEAGGDPDYDGLGGPYEFVDAGEPAAASYRIATYDGGATPNPELDTYVFAS
jgi:ABC-type branched-subunit amino acid transport system substrate-binding protein